MDQLSTLKIAPAGGPFSHSINPFELDLIVEKVLEYMDHRNVLNCRRLNRQWNNKALGLLRGKNAVLELHSGNIVEYLRLVAATGQREPNLKLSFQFGRNGDTVETHHTLMIGINQLLQQFGVGVNQAEGVRFVESLFCTSCYRVELDWASIAQLIRRIAPGLRRIQIKEGVFNQYISYMNLDAVNGFPELQSVSYAAILKNACLLSQIVNKGPKLTRLQVHMEPLERHNPQSFSFRIQNLVHTFNSITASSLAHLTELATVLDSRETYVALQRLHFPRLEKLRLTLNTNADEESAGILAQFLVQNCPNLSSLEFNLAQSVDRAVIFPHDTLISEFPPRFPYLPKVVHFGYGVSRMPVPTNGPAMIRLDNLGHQHLPGLREATVKFGAFLYSSEPLAGFSVALPVEWYSNHALVSNAAWPGVGRLRLVLEDLDGLFRASRVLGYPDVTARDACNQLHLLYPNVRHLRLDIQLRPTEETMAELHFVLRYLLEELVGLESLEIWSNCVSFLPRTLNVNAEIAARHPDLKELRFPRVDRETRDLLTRRAFFGCPAPRSSDHLLPPESPELSLRFILGFFPGLERITVASEFVNRKELAELEARYPNVRINVI